MAAPGPLAVSESMFGGQPLPDGRPTRRFDLSNGVMTVSLLEYVCRGGGWVPAARIGHTCECA
jgi:hypothetical protein